MNFSRYSKWTFGSGSPQALASFCGSKRPEPPIFKDDTHGTAVTTRDTWTPWYDEATNGRGLLHSVSDVELLGFDKLFALNELVRDRVTTDRQIEYVFILGRSQESLAHTFDSGRDCWEPFTWGRRKATFKRSSIRRPASWWR